MKFGHIATTCIEQNSQKNSGHNVGFGKNTGYDKNHGQEINGMKTYMVGPETFSTPFWLVDSGATNHYTPSIDNIQIKE